MLFNIILELDSAHFSHHKFLCDQRAGPRRICPSSIRTLLASRFAWYNDWRWHFFDPDFPDFFGFFWHLQRGCGSNFWWCLRQKAMTLGRPSLEDRAYRGIPQCDPRMASGHNCHKLEDYQRCVYTVPYQK